jgi:hypothetical protein
MDLLAIEGSKIYGGLSPILHAAIEMKSQKGSIGNNQNNRIEEALGSASDMHASYNAGLFGDVADRPFFGYVFVIDNENATNEVGLNHPHFDSSIEFSSSNGVRHGKFKGPSYECRYQISFRKMVRAGMYDAICFITTCRPAPGQDAPYCEPDPQLSSRLFLEKLESRLLSA